MPSDGEPPTGLSRRSYLKLAAASAAVFGTGEVTAVHDFGVVDDPERLTSARELQVYYSGPEGDRPQVGDVATGTRYFATDTGREFVATASEWRWQGASVPTLTTEQVRGVADHLVTDTETLERAFADLAPGDTVYVAAGEYRPDDWLYVEADDVTVVGAGRRATLIRPADGANCGGIHVGPDRRVSNVFVSGIGFHGNEATMDDDVKRCHAFVVENAEHVTVERCFATRTHPYHVHDAGGSGFTVRRQASDVTVAENFTTDIGDRSIQVAGTNVSVARNRLTNGFDRAISLDVRHPGGRKYYARNVSVVGNLGRDNSNGSVIGASQGNPRRKWAGNYAIVGNVAAGRHRRMVFVGVDEDARNVVIAGNSGRQDSFDEERSGIYLKNGVSNAAIVGNTLRGYSLHGIEVEGRGQRYTVTGNVVYGPRADGVHAAIDGGVVTGNAVDSPGRDGIAVTADDAVVANNAVSDAGGHGLVLDGVADALVANNRVSGSGRGDSVGIRVDATDSLVSANRVTVDGVALREGRDADRNLYVGNYLAAPERPDVVEITGVGSRLVGNVPELDRHEVTTSDGTATVRFDRPYDVKPRLDVQTDAATNWRASWRRRGGAFVGVDLDFFGPGGDRVSPAARVAVSGPR